MTKIKKEDIKTITPLFSIQEELLLDFLKNPTGNYCEQLVVRISANLILKKVQLAWQKVIQTNEVLRSVYRWEQLSNPVQIVLKETFFNIKAFDFSGKREEEKEKLVTETILKDRQTPFNLTKTPFRVSCMKLSEDYFVLLISHHHILYDGWSSTNILNEFVGYYEEQIHVPVKKISIHEYQQFLEDGKKKQDSYWQNYLSNFNEPVILPIRKTVVDLTDSKRFSCFFKIDNTRIDNILKQYHLTLASLIYSLWSITMFKYTQKEDLLFGIVQSGRNIELPYISESVGLFIKTMPLRVTVRNEDTFTKIGESIKNDMIEKMDKVFHSYSDIKKAGGGNLGNSELFDTLITVENYPFLEVKKNAEKKMKIDSIDYYHKNNFPINIEVSNFEDEATLEIKFDFILSHFDQSDCQRIVDYFNSLFELVENNLDIKVLDIPNLLENEKNIIESNQQGQVIPLAKKSLIEQFDDIARKRPTDIAIKEEGKTITFHELTQIKNQIAKNLEQNYIGEEVVGVYLHESSELLSVLLAILSSGKTFVLIDPDLPFERVKYLIEDAKISLLVVEHPVSFFPNEKQTTFEEINNKVDCLEKKNSCEKAENKIAYIVYTSGSTGKPKGVKITQENITNYFHSYFAALEINSPMNSLLLTALSFDLFIENIFVPLLTGGKLVIISKKKRMEIDVVHELLKQENICFLTASPLLINELNKLPKINSLKYIVNGGERIKKEHISKLIDHVSIFNVYGPAEATIGATYYKIPKRFDGFIPIGQPLPNYSVYVLDEVLKPVPQGVQGEIYIGGIGVSAGYTKKYEEKREAFFETEAFNGDRLYKTGDFGYWSSENQLVFMGRKDRQIKINGYRIEAGEIETHINEYFEGDCALVFQTTAVLDKRNQLIAFLYKKTEKDILPLRKYLSKKLPYYMIPSKIIPIEKYLYTPSGKIDVKQLIDEYYIKLEQTNNNEIFLDNEIEVMIYNIWTEELGTDHFNKESNFFELGGESLTLMHVYNKLNQALEEKGYHKVSMQDLYDYQTISLLSDQIIGTHKKSEETYQKFFID